MKFLIFTIHNQYCAIELNCVKQVIWSVAITPIAQTEPSYVAGVINVHGEIMPVINVRQLLKQPPLELNLNDKFIISLFDNQPSVLWVDKVHEIKDYSEDQFHSTYNKNDSMHLPYAIKDEDKIVYFYPWEKLLKMEAQSV